MSAPVRFEPFLRPMVWGGRLLGEALGKSLPTGQNYGESWEISDHPSHHSEVAAGPWRGQSLRDLMERDRHALLGSAASAHARFPWLVKLLDASEWLSVQVHPDEVRARQLSPGEGGKTEAWFILDARPGSRIYAGLRPGTNEAKLRAALESGTVIECLHSFTPRAGDCVFLPAGTIHAVGGGVLMAEVQQTSDATFRLHDWGRRDAQGKARPLHVREALACVDWSFGGVDPVPCKGFTVPVASVGGLERETLVRCPHFLLEYVQGREPIVLGGEGRLQVLVVLRGAGRWNVAGDVGNAAVGQAWLLPAALPRFECLPSPILGGMLCTLP